MKMLLNKPAQIISVVAIMLASLPFLVYAGDMVSDTRPVPVFEQIEVNGNFNLFITQGKVCSLRVEAERDDMKNIRTEVKDNRLVIDNEKSEFKLFLTKKRQRNIYIALPELKKLCINGASEVKGQNIIRTGDIDIEINGAADIEMEIESKNIRTFINGAGEILFIGKSSNLAVTINGAGELAATNFPVDSANVMISGAGDCRLNVARALVVDISGSGDIRYRGGAVSVKQNISGAEKIIKE